MRGPLRRHTGRLAAGRLPAVTAVAAVAAALPTAPPPALRAATRSAAHPAENHCWCRASTCRLHHLAALPAAVAFIWMPLLPSCVLLWPSSLAAGFGMLLVVPCSSNARWVQLHCRAGGSQLHGRVHRSCIGMHGCMAFAFVCRKLGPRGTSRKNESGLSPEFRRTRRVPSLSRIGVMCVRACCSAHVCHSHIRTAGLESGGDYLLNISAASSGGEAAAAAGTTAHVACHMSVPQPVSVSAVSVV